MTKKENDMPERIAKLEAGEIDDLIHAARKRYSQLHPDSELIVASIPKHNMEERAAFYEWLLRYVRDHEQ